MSGPIRRTPRHRSRLARLGTVAVTVGAVALLAGCGPETAADDAVIDAGTDEVSGSASEFVVPQGTISVTVGDPVDEVTEDDTADREALSAPDGSSLLPVLVDFANQADAPWGGLLAAQPQEADVSVTVAGEQRDLGSPYRVSGETVSGSATQAYFVVVPDEAAGDQVRIEVAYDGASQSAAPGEEPTGPAAALATLPTEAPDGAECPPDAWRSSGTALEVECELPMAGRTPYWPGSGWATGESQWAVVSVQRLQVYPARGSDDEVRSIEGSGATAQLEHGSWGPTGLTGTVVVDSSELADDALPLEVGVSLDSPSGAGDSVTASYSVPIPAGD